MTRKNEVKPKKARDRNGTIDALKRPFESMVVLRGQRELTVYGCKKILLYTPPEICLSVSKKRLCIIGDSLICTSFTGGAVTVEGRIRSVRYEADTEDVACV